MCMLHPGARLEHETLEDEEILAVEAVWSQSCGGIGWSLADLTHAAQ
jgi:hypothetical protein